MPVESLCACVVSYICARSMVRSSYPPARSLLVRSIDFWKESWGGRRERERGSKDLACVVYMSVLCSDDQCLAIIWIRALLYTLLLFDSPLPFYPFLYNIGESTFSHSTATKNREKLN